MFILILQNNRKRFYGFQIAEESKLPISRGIVFTQVVVDYVVYMTAGDQFRNIW